VAAGIISRSCEDRRSEEQKIRRSFSLVDHADADVLEKETVFVF
jgi:hypothetical protein